MRKATGDAKKPRTKVQAKVAGEDHSAKDAGEIRLTSLLEKLQATKKRQELLRSELTEEVVQHDEGAIEAQEHHDQRKQDVTPSEAEYELVGNEDHLPVDVEEQTERPKNLQDAAATQVTLNESSGEVQRDVERPAAKESVLESLSKSFTHSLALTKIETDSLLLEESRKVLSRIRSSGRIAVPADISGDGQLNLTELSEQIKSPAPEPVPLSTELKKRPSDVRDQRDTENKPKRVHREEKKAAVNHTEAPTIRSSQDGFLQLSKFIGDKVTVTWDHHHLLKDAKFDLILTRDHRADTLLKEANVRSTEVVLPHSSDRSETLKLVLRASIEVEIHRPAAPSGFRFTGITSSSTTVSWNHQPECSYLISYATEVEPESVFMEVNTTDNYYAFHHLTAGESYIFTIRSVHRTGGLSPAVTLTTTTLPSVVKNLKPYYLSSDTLKTSWEGSLGAHNFVIKVIDILSQKQLQELRTEVDDEGHASITISSLPRGKALSVEVFSCNTSGVEKEGSKLIITPLSPASNLQLSPTSATAKLVLWDHDASAAQYRIEVGEQVYYSSSPQYELTSLIVGSEYHVEVFSANTYGVYETVGAHINFVNCFDAPVVTVTDLTADRAEISWRALAGKNEYRVALKKDGDDFKDLSTVTGTSFSITRLSHSVAYTASVVAIDALTNVESEPSHVNFVPVGATSFVIVSDITTDSARVIWDEGVGAERYLVELKPKLPNITEPKFVVVVESDRLAALDGLDSQTGYSVRIRSAGPGGDFENRGGEAEFTTSSVDPKSQSKLLSLMLTSLRDDKASIRWKAVAEATRYTVQYADLAALEFEGGKRWIQWSRKAATVTTEIIQIDGFSQQRHQFAMKVDAYALDKFGRECTIASDEVYILPPELDSLENYEAFLEQLRRLKLRYNITTPISVDDIERGSHYLINGITCHISQDRTIVVRVGGGFEYLSVWFSKHIVPYVGRSAGYDRLLQKKGIDPTDPTLISRKSSVNDQLKKSNFDLLKERRVSCHRIMI